MNLGFIRQYLGEVSPERTFTAKELWEVFNTFAPLMSEEQEKEIVETIKGLDTHTVKEERCVGCKEMVCDGGVDCCCICHQKEEPTTPEKTSEFEAIVYVTDKDGKKEMKTVIVNPEQSATPEKKCCSIDGKNGYHSLLCNRPDLKKETKLPTSSYEVTCGRCEKSIKHSCGAVK